MVSATLSDRCKLVRAGLFCLVLTACSPAETILEGERINVRPDKPASLVSDATAEISLPAPVTNANWSHLNGASSHFAGHVAAEFPLEPLWRADIGAGNGRNSFITGGPVVEGGRVFAMDGQSRVSAFDLDGTPLWTRDLVPTGENPRGVFGGGVSASTGLVVVGTGYGEIVALDAETGEEIWRQEMEAPVRAAPVIQGDRVYAVARNDQAFGIDLKNGRIRWRMTSVEPDAGISGGASPAARGGLVVMPFGSGEVAGALSRNGRRSWTTYIAGGRRGTVLGRINDITGDPVIAGDTIFVANQSGQFAALDRSTGERVWSTRDGSLGPALPVDNSVFMITDIGVLKRLRASDGTEIWTVELPRFANAEDKSGVHTHFGPLLMDGRIIVASSDGFLRSFDPQNGAPLGETELGGGAAAQPAIAQGRLFVTTSDGALAVFE